MGPVSTLLGTWKQESTYGDNMIVLHEARLMTSEQHQHAEYKGHNGTSHREQSGYAHYEDW